MNKKNFRRTNFIGKLTLATAILLLAGCKNTYTTDKNAPGTDIIENTEYASETDNDTTDLSKNNDNADTSATTGIKPADYQTGLYQENFSDYDYLKTISEIENLHEGEYTALAYSYDNTVSVWGNNAEDILILHDKEHEYTLDICWRSMYMQPPCIASADYDGDGQNEYFISTLGATGSGVYIEELYYVDIKNGSAFISSCGSQITSELSSRIKAADKPDDRLRTLHVDFYDKYNKPASSIDLRLASLLDRCPDALYADIITGSQLSFEMRGNKPFATAIIGIQLKAPSTPLFLYDTSIHVTAPVILNEDGTFSLGDFAVEEFYSDEEKQPIDETNMQEVYTGYFDLTHDGMKEKVITMVYTGNNNQNPISSLYGDGYGIVAVYSHISDDKYENIPLWAETFSLAPDGNIQLFITHKDGFDYLIKASTYAGQGSFSYSYDVISPDNFYFDSCHETSNENNLSASQFFEGIEKWLNEDSLLLVTADIDMPEGMELILTTDNEKHNPMEYLDVKK